MSTQLRLVDAPEPRDGARGRSTRRARIATAKGRRVRWDADWRLDSRTRRAGREGVAAARATLERVPRPDLPKAS